MRMRVSTASNDVCLLLWVMTMMVVVMVMVVWWLFPPCQAFLESLGFEQTSSHFEWRKAEESPEAAEEYIKVVRAAIDLLGHLKDGGGTCVRESE